MRASRFMCAFAIALLSATCDNRFRTATVIKMAYIYTPDNLSDASECRVLWNDIARFGIEMDRASKEWNKVILNAATFLVEKGCVKRTYSQF